MEDADCNIHLRNLSTHQARDEEEALNLLFQGDTNRMIAEVCFLFDCFVLFYIGFNVIFLDMKIITIYLQPINYYTFVFRNFPSFFFFKLYLF